MASGRLQRWALILAAYDYSIQNQEGSKNANADALSRVPLPSAVKFQTSRTGTPDGTPGVVVPGKE